MSGNSPEPIQLAVEGQVAILDTNSRKVTSAMQRMRRQENTKSGQ
jgi:hypothetical protein